MIVEVQQLHRIFLSLKKRGGLEDVVFFAAGNEVDRMFILVKNGFRDAFMRYVESGHAQFD
jgi:hypothetical protein